MDNMLFFGILVFVYFESQVLRQQAPDLFAHIFSRKWGILIMAGMGILLILSVLFQPTMFSTLAGYFLGVAYLLRREKFKRNLALIPVDELPVNSRLTLAAGSFDILLIWFGGMLGCMVAIKIFKTIFPQIVSRLDELAGMAAFSSILMVVLIRWLVARLPPLTFKEAVGFKAAGIPKLKLIVLPIFLGITFAILSSCLLYSRVQQPETPLNEILETTTSSWAILFFVMIAVLLAPLLEELIFRGFFFYVLKECRGPLFALIFVSLIFGVLHMDQYWGDWLAIAAVMTLGVLLTLLRLWLGSSIPGIITHYFYNGTMIIIPVIILLFHNPAYTQYQLNYTHLTDSQKEELLLMSIESDPAHGPSYNDLAWLYAQENKNLDEAAQLVAQALSLEPDNPAYLDTQAEVFYKMGNYAEAVKIGQQVLESYADHDYAQKQLTKFKAALKNRP